MKRGVGLFVLVFLALILLNSINAEVISSVPASVSCTDSDGGLNYNIKGIVDSSYNGVKTSSADKCAVNGKDLVEYFCTNNRFDSRQYTCEKGCKDGACISAETAPVATQEIKTPATSAETNSAIGTANNEPVKEIKLSWLDRLQIFWAKLNGKTITGNSITGKAVSAPPAACCLKDLNTGSACAAGKVNCDCYSGCDIETLAVCKSPDWNGAMCNSCGDGICETAAQYGETNANCPADCPRPCTSFTYSDWSPATCPASGTQTRTVLTSSPSGCSGGTPVTSQTCNYTAPVTEIIPRCLANINENETTGPFTPSVIIWINATAPNGHDMVGYCGGDYYMRAHCIYANGSWVYYSPNPNSSYTYPNYDKRLCQYGCGKLTFQNSSYNLYFDACFVAPKVCFYPDSVIVDKIKELQNARKIVHLGENQLDSIMAGDYLVIGQNGKSRLLKLIDLVALSTDYNNQTLTFNDVISGETLSFNVNPFSSSSGYATLPIIIDGNTYYIKFNRATGVGDTEPRGIIQIHWGSGTNQDKYDPYWVGDQIDVACLNGTTTPTCTDTDNGKDYYTKGVIYLDGQYHNEDKCGGFSGNTLNEWYCDSNGANVESYDCPENCSYGACINSASNQTPTECTPQFYCTIDPTICPASGSQIKNCKDIECGQPSYTENVTCNPGECSGCELNKQCIPYGFRTQVNLYENNPGTYNVYCDITGEFKEQKTKVGAEWAKCQNNYECFSNICTSGECAEPASMISDIKTFFVGMFCKVLHPISDSELETCKAEYLS